MLTWYIAQVSQAGRRAAVALKEHRFSVYFPMERVWRSIPKGGREAVDRPLFPGYLFVGAGPWNGDNPLDQFHNIDGLTRIVPTKLSAERLAQLVYDMTLRQCAGEFDQTAARQYLPPKPLIGPLSHTVGHGLTALERLIKTDAEGRIDLLTSGDILEADEEPVRVAA